LKNGTKQPSRASKPPSRAEQENPVQEELDLAKKRIGELCMENELLRERSRRNGVFLGGKWK
jgi:hypothetical protein